MAVVKELYENADKVVCRCKLRTLTKGNKVLYIDRPVTKLYPLEIVSNKPQNHPSNADVVSTEKSPDISVNAREERQSTRPRTLAAEQGIEKRRNENQS